MSTEEMSDKEFKAIMFFALVFILTIFGFAGYAIYDTLENGQKNLSRDDCDIYYHKHRAPTIICE